MKIEVWLDYACPFCYIGKRSLEEAIASYSQEELFQVEFKSFQLDPDHPPYNGENYYEMLAKKVGSVEQAKEKTVHISKLAENFGLQLNFDDIKATNTFDAHRLTKYAKTFGKDHIIAEKLFHAHFVEGKDIGDLDTLTTLATEANLQEEDVRSMLENKEHYSIEVVADLQAAQHYQIRGVPFFIFNEKYELSGAQPAEFFVQAFEQIQNAEKERTEK